MAGPVETKVQASAAAAAASGLALWALGNYVFKAGVPDVVASWIYVLVPGVITFGAGYLAKHTARPLPSWPAKTLIPPATAAAEQPPAPAGSAEPAAPE
jgi:hypothetical protein